MFYLFICNAGQLLSYILVVDFESTCWEDKKGQPEISERLPACPALPRGFTVAEHVVLVLEHVKLYKCVKSTACLYAWYECLQFQCNTAAAGSGLFNTFQKSKEFHSLVILL